MANAPSPLGIKSNWIYCGAMETMKPKAASSLICRSKVSNNPEGKEVGKIHFSGETLKTVINAHRSLELRGLAATQVSVDQTEQIYKTRVQIEEPKKVFTYLFRTEAGSHVKVFVRRKILSYAVEIEVSSFSECENDSTLVLIWGIYRSDSSYFMPLAPQHSAEDSESSTTESTMVMSCSDTFSLELEFEANQFPFYFSFWLKSPSSGHEYRSHRKSNFCVPVGFKRGYPAPLGLSFLKDGSMNFAVFSRNSESVVLCLYDDSTADKPALEIDLDPYINRTGDIWHASIGGTWNLVNYGYRFKGINLQGNRENRYTEQILLDPYAKVAESFSINHQESGLPPRYLGRLCKEPVFDWRDDVRLNIPKEKLVVYQMNVARFTEHVSSQLPYDMAGTFSGLTEKVHHLKSLGMNAVLLEPIFPFNEQRGPYFPLSFFSPMNKYGLSNNDPISTINTMKEMVKKLHTNGIEVLLEVVYTHTADCGALQGIDDGSYYYNNRHESLEPSNDLNCNYPVVQQMILDSLRYWVTEFHIDGFCFINASSLLRGLHGEYLSRPPLVEAIAFDPLLSKTKIIADCWDPHDMLPKETRFPHWKRWGEINTKFCNDVRNFLRGEGLLSDIATRLCGSGDMFSDGRGPAFSFNFIARSFGLPLVDLVSFSNVVELASHLSWNCGEEGPTTKTVVLERRLKQIRNYLFILYVSLGVPILNMGDECGQTSGGSPLYDNRKAIDWNALATGFGTQITQFISFLTSLRTRRGDIFQRKNFLKEENIDWYGNDQSPPLWEDPSCKFLAMMLKADKSDSLSSPESSPSRGNLFIAFNVADHSESVLLPTPPEGMEWRRLVDTARPFPGFFSDNGMHVLEEIAGTFSYEMKSHSCILFEADLVADPGTKEES